MNLKDVMAADIAGMLNTGEFADQYDVEMGGEQRTIEAVMDDDTSDQPLLAQSDGLILSIKRFHTRTGDLPRPPVMGKSLRINGEAYIVRHISEEGGMTVLVLEVYESGG